MTDAVVQTSISPDVIALQNVTKKIQEVVRMQLIGFYNNSNAPLSSNYANYGGLPEVRLPTRNYDKEVTNLATRFVLNMAAINGELDQSVVREAIEGAGSKEYGAMAPNKEVHTALVRVLENYQAKHHLPSQDAALDKLSQNVATALTPVVGGFKSATEALRSNGTLGKVLDDISNGLTAEPAIAH